VVVDMVAVVDMVVDMVAVVDMVVDMVAVVDMESLDIVEIACLNMDTLIGIIAMEL
jgi:hypothetical protein